VANDGKAVFMSGGIAPLSGTFTGHQPGAADSALFTVQGGTLVLDGAIVHHNSAVRLADLYGPSPNLLFVYSTVSDNDFDALVLDAHVPPPPPGAELAGKYYPFPVLELTNSVFAETEPLYAPPLPTAAPILDCLVSRYASMLVTLPVGSSTTKVLYADPRFANAAAGDYHVAISSPVVDLCMPRSGILLPDPDGDVRGTDAANTANPTGRTFDAGVDEVTYLFADDFETGNTSRWSSTIP